MKPRIRVPSRPNIRLWDYAVHGPNGMLLCVAVNDFPSDHEAWRAALKFRETGESPYPRKVR